ncbi:MAG: D-glycero-beta-D-manno-heptose 1-phosphate adenylyltransferase [Acidobacteriota bacterium]
MEKVRSLDEIIEIKTNLKKHNKKIVFTNGCFDLIHPGHIRLFKWAESMGDILIVGVNTDDSVKVIKGKNRPIFPLNERLEILESIEYIDYLVPFDEETPLELIKNIEPDFLIKGGDYNTDQVVGRDFVESYGGRVLIFPYQKKYSTSAIIAKILNT